MESLSMGKKVEAAGRKAIQIANYVVEITVMTILVLLAAFTGYALWDTKQLHQAALSANYAVYKPTVENEGKSFQELQTINPEVVAWLTVHGTDIDYPVTQGPNNMKYVNTNAEGKYSLTGAIFLHYKNSEDFSDFNSILYGHHMAGDAMFGQIGSFAKKDVFESRRYGNLYYNGKDFGIEFFAFVHCDAYDRTIFTENVEESQRKAYLEGLMAKATHTRDIGVTVTDRIILLSTCSTETTNGRDILIGRITDRLYPDAFKTTKKEIEKTQAQIDNPAGIPSWQWTLITGLAILIMTTLNIIIIHGLIKRRRTAKARIAARK